jgi:hypothetical protein
LLKSISGIVQYFLDCGFYRAAHNQITRHARGQPGKLGAEYTANGHESFDPTEKYYIMGQSRVAGRALVRAMSMVRK